MGGVQSGRDVVDLLAAGASSVALGTILFADPDAPTRVRAELDAECSARGFTSVDEIVRIAHDAISTEHGQRGADVVRTP
jgi:dihydroorotate dehydrogenase (NAD+) catalytic subunit